VTVDTIGIIGSEHGVKAKSTPRPKKVATAVRTLLFASILAVSWSSPAPSRPPAFASTPLNGLALEPSAAGNGGADVLAAASSARSGSSSRTS